jgi:DNA-binding MarR family transcriptional regulator
MNFGDNEPLALLHFGFRAVVKLPDAELARLGLGRVHHRILFFIARAPGLPVSELVAILDVSKQALHAPLRRLVHAGLVFREAIPTDRRARTLQLTARGKALEERLSGHQRQLFAAAFRNAGPVAARGWATVMQRLAEHPPKEVVGSRPHAARVRSRVAAMPARAAPRVEDSTPKGVRSSLRTRRQRNASKRKRAVAGHRKHRSRLTNMRGESRTLCR